jgi:hypothetical protein
VSIKEDIADDHPIAHLASMKTMFRQNFLSDADDESNDADESASQSVRI